jgi:hypothetical protein
VLVDVVGETLWPDERAVGVLAGPVLQAAEAAQGEAHAVADGGPSEHVGADREALVLVPGPIDEPGDVRPVRIVFGSPVADADQGHAGQSGSAADRRRSTQRPRAGVLGRSAAWLTNSIASSGEIREPWLRRPSTQRRAAVLAAVMALVAVVFVVLDLPTWLSMTAAVPCAVAVMYLRILSYIVDPWAGPGMLSDFADDIRGRAGRSDAWKEERVGPAGGDGRGRP